MPPDIPGFYYDVERKKYFKITNGSLTTQTKYHNNTVQAAQRRDDFYNQLNPETKKRKTDQPQKYKREASSQKHQRGKSGSINQRGNSSLTQHKKLCRMSYRDKVQLVNKCHMYYIKEQIFLLDYSGVIGLKTGTINQLLPFYGNDVVDLVGINAARITIPTTRNSQTIPLPMLCHLIGSCPTYQICKVPEPLQIVIDDHKALGYFHAMGQPISKSTHVSSYKVFPAARTSSQTMSKTPSFSTSKSNVLAKIEVPTFKTSPYPEIFKISKVVPSSSTQPIPTPSPYILLLKSISIHFDPDIINLFRFFWISPKSFKTTDFTSPVLRYVSQHLTNPKHRILFGLGLLTLPQSQPTYHSKTPPTVDEINRALQLLNTSSLPSHLRHLHTQKVDQFLAHHNYDVIDTKEYSYKPIVVKNPERDHFVATLVTDSEIFLLSNTFDLFMINFSIRGNDLALHGFQHLALSIHGRSDFSQIIDSGDVVHITTGSGILTIKKSSMKHSGHLLKYIYYKSSPVIKQIFLLKPFTFVLIKPRTISLLKYRGQPHFINSKPISTDASYEETELGTYFNDNNPTPCITLFNNHLYINETAEDFQVINLGRTAEFGLNSKRFKVPRPEGRKKVTNLVVDMDETGLVELGLTYDEEFFVRFKL